VKRLLLTYLKPYRRRIALIAALVLTQAIGNLYLPTLNADIINNGVVKGDTGYILRIGFIMLGIALLITSCSVTSAFNGAKTAMGLGRDVRGDLYRKVESLSQSEMGRFGTPSLITRNTNDIQQVQMLVALGLSMMLLAPMLAIGGIIMALRQDVPLSISIAIILPIMGVFLFLVLRRAIPLFRTMQARIDRINQIMRETLGGVRVIRAFARTDYEEKRFGTANEELTSTTVSVFRLFSLVFPILLMIVNLSMVGIIWFGGHRVDSGGMPVGNLFAFVAYVMQIMFAVMMSVMMASMIPRASASATRIQDVLDVDPAIRDPRSPIALPTRGGGLRGLVEFRDVEFRYPGAQDAILSHISFTARPGETTAIVGSTGSGKSTLIGLIPRLNDVTDGSILIDGQDIRTMNRADLWRHIGFVPQKAFLFSGTVASNLRYGNPDATDEELWQALRIAQAEDFVSAMPEGLQEPITQGGMSVSGGQRQRLAIARALVKKADIHVFDDSFSALDLKTDSMLRAALKRETRDATVIVVAQRVSTILHADQIVVLEEGGVCGIGGHADLVDRCQTYREIVLSQLTAEEVA
jgi:ATP-binding cassette, subfamily B, multidrug efflux pump